MVSHSHHFDTLILNGYNKNILIYEGDFIMYNILLVDDEKTVLDALLSEISWEQLGVNNIMTATNGIQALEILNERHIDLLITDICMPQMDGLELLSQVHTLYPHLHSILLTAYGEFEYARKALQLGVENYLLKPFIQEELENTIEKALDNIYKNHHSTKQLFQNNILSRWVTDSITIEELSERARLLNINIFLNAYCVVCIRKRNSTDSILAYIEGCTQHLDTRYVVYSFFDAKGRYVLIIGGNGLTASCVSSIFLSTEQNAPTKNNFIISIGSIVNSSEKVAESYQNACLLLETSNFATLKSPVLIHDSSLRTVNDILINELNTLFLVTDTEEREKGFHELIQKWTAYKNTSDSALLQQIAQSLIQLFNQEFPDKPGIQKQIFSHINLFTKLPGSKDFSSVVFDLLCYSYLLFRDYFNQLSPIVQQAINYIRTNYTQAPSVKEFCDKKQMNTCYLGYLFKNETGMFFNNYLTQYRICCALQLLLETNLTINAIAQKTGFSTTNYFITCFKKQLSISPNKYRTLNDKI